jgi:hypothetical protein
VQNVEVCFLQQGHTLCAEHDYLGLEGGAHGAGLRRAGPTVRMSMFGRAEGMQLINCGGVGSVKNKGEERKRKEMKCWKTESTQSKEPNKAESADRSCSKVCPGSQESAAGDQSALFLSPCNGGYWESDSRADGAQGRCD